MSFIIKPSFQLISKFIKVPNVAVHLPAAGTASLRLLHRSVSLNGKGIPLKMPSLSPTMVEGKIVKWLKQEGDPIEPGDVICDIETDKAVVSFEVDEEGVLAKILVGQDSGVIKIGTLIAVMAAEGDDWQKVEIPVLDGASSDATASASQTTSVTTPAGGEGNWKYGPSVRILLEEYGLWPAQVVTSGPHGELLKGDLLKHVAINKLERVPLKPVAPPRDAPVSPSAGTAISPPEAYIPTPLPVGPPSYTPHTDVEVSNMRRTIAKRLSQSKSGIAHSYGTLECRLDELLALRTQFKEDGATVSVNDLLVKAVSVALQTCPAVNCVWQGEQLVTSSSVDISVAVSTPSGLITPIVRGAHKLGVTEIAATVRELAARARQNKLKPEEFMGGTFTISNLGMFGITEFSAIINPPQCAILAVGGGMAGIGFDGARETRIRATLSYDRLAIDDHTAGEFLAALAQLIEHPTQLLLGKAAQSGVHPLQALL